MSLSIDGWTYLFFDKFAGSNNYDNPFTSKIKMEDLMALDCTVYNNDEAIKVFNSNNDQDVIPNNMNYELYKIMMFVTSYGNNVMNVSRYTILCVNEIILDNMVTNKLPISNQEFLIKVCRYHNCYNKILQFGQINSKKDQYDEISKDIINKVSSTTGDIIDPIIQNPDFLTCQLYDYQKRSIYWMIEKEKNETQIQYNINDEVIIGNVHYDAMKQTFNVNSDHKKIMICGGSLNDQVGLGKTVQMTTLSLMNPYIDDINNNNYVKENINKYHSKANLVLCPNQLCGQWKRELEKMIQPSRNIKIVTMLTKVHFDKYTYRDLLDADFVIISFNFFDNKAFLNPWMKEISSSGTYHKTEQSSFDTKGVKTIFEKMGKELIADKTSLLKVNPIVTLIKWHRIIIDEIHEIYTVPKYNYMKNMLPLLDGRYRWCVSGTPFEKNNDGLLMIFDFVTKYENTYGSKILTVKSISEYLKNKFFRRNTKQSVNDEFKLPPLKESVIWLKFTQTERMMYNAYLANPNNDKYSKFLRQLCCHPKLADETKELLANCKTLGDIEKLMVEHYKQQMTESHKIVTYYDQRIEITRKKIKIIERKRQKKYLIQIGYDAEFSPNDIAEMNLNLNDELQENYGDLMINLNNPDVDDDYEIKPTKKLGKKIIISDDNQDEISKLVGHLLNLNKSKTIDNLNEYIKDIQYKLIPAKKDLEGKKITYEFYKNVFDKIKKTAENKTHDEDEDETCGICLTEIPDDDIGVTKCGHIYCFQCIKTIISQRHECPYCRAKIKDDEVFMISYEKKKNNKANNQDLKDKIALINEVGTKLANLIYYLKGSDNHVIIFSQWDDLLRKIGNILDIYGVKNVFCRGNVWQRDKAIRTFNNDKNMRVIMLSSESAASGTNLTKANKVIIVDPVCGTHEYRKNTEGQAIGRAHRMGQTSEVEVLRFVVRDTIEEEIYNTNNEEDKKHISLVKIFETNDDDIILSKDKVEELEEALNEPKKIKEKKIIVKGKKGAKKVESEDDEY